MVKNPPAIWESWVWSLGWEGSLEEGMTTHSSILAKRIPTDRGAWQATVHEVTMSWTWLSEVGREVAAAAAKSLQSCPILCDPTDSSPPGSAVPGILQARTLEWVAISFSNAWKWKTKVKSLSCARLLATPWMAAYQAPLSMGFSRQEYWSGVPLDVGSYYIAISCDKS